MSPPRGHAAALWAFAGAALVCPYTSAALSSRANPVRKVVTMLQKMQDNVKKEEKEELQSFDKYMCYCQTTRNKLEQSIEDGKVKIDALTASVKATAEKLASTKNDLQKHQDGRDDAKDSIAEATNMRQKEAVDYRDSKAEWDANILAMEKAIASLTKGVGGAFLQSKTSRQLLKFINDKTDLEDSVRTELLEFFSSGKGQAKSPGSDEIMGVLKQLKDSMTADLNDATTEERNAQAQFETLEATKKKEIAALTTQIEEELLRVGELGEDHAMQKNELGDAKKQLIEDEKFTAEMAINCQAKQKEYEGIKEMHAKELVALGETIKFLNSDDALELFKKTSSLQESAASVNSFLQVASRASITSHRRKKALETLRAHSKRRRGKGRPELNLIAMALHGKKQGFEKVVWMIERMSRNLNIEQKDDDKKKAYCLKKLDISEDKKKSLQLSISDTQAAIDDVKGTLVEMKEERSSLLGNIQSLDMSVKEATMLRQNDHEEHKELMAADGTAKELLTMAKNRMQKFYNPSLAKAAVLLQRQQQQEMDDDEQEDDDSESVESFMQLGARRTAVEARKQESAGVIQLMNDLIADLDREMQVAEVEEKEAQKDYEVMLQEAAKKRAQDQRTLNERETATAQTQTVLETEMQTSKDFFTELMEEMTYIKNLHSDCDWLLTNYDERKDARTDEIDALAKSKAVLSGADYS